MTFGFMLLAAALMAIAWAGFELEEAAKRKDVVQVQGVLLVAFLLVAAATVVSSCAWEWHQQDYHPDRQEEVQDAEH